MIYQVQIILENQMVQDGILKSNGNEAPRKKLYVLRGQEFMKLHHDVIEKMLSGRCDRTTHIIFRKRGTSQTRRPLQKSHRSNPSQQISK